VNALVCVPPEALSIGPSDNNGDDISRQADSMARSIANIRKAAMGVLAYFAGFDSQQSLPNILFDAALMSQIRQRSYARVSMPCFHVPTSTQREMLAGVQVFAQ
jgi:hypothetical protein